MNPEYLPAVGPVENAEKDYLKRFEHIAAITGKKCLCIGYSESEVDEYIVKYQPGEIVLLTNWTDHSDARVAKYPLVIGDITQQTDFADGTFDAVLTIKHLERHGVCLLWEE